MFYILVFTGVSLIILGILSDKKETPRSMTYESATQNEINELKIRIKDIENILYYHEPELEDNTENNTEDFSATLESITHSNNLYNNSLEIYKKICQYESENYSLEDICELLNMNKGEVLLLKNLFKSYQG